jgi:hypothetical protein
MRRRNRIDLTASAGKNRIFPGNIPFLRQADTLDEPMYFCVRWTQYFSNSA